MPEHVDRSRDFERFVTFVDAIVAIAITLLVLPLADAAAELEGGSVTGLLADRRDQIGAFLLSFVVIAALWFAQHRTVRTVMAHDTLVTRLMVAWTLTIVALPFPTALVAEAGSQAATKVLYIGTMTLSSVLIALMSWAIGRNRGIRDRDERPDVRQAVGMAAAFALALGVSVAVPATGYYPLLVLLVPGPAIGLWRRRSSNGPAAGRRVGE